MLQRFYFLLLTIMCIIIKVRTIVADTKNVLMENDTVSPLSEQPEFDPHPYSGPGSSMGITYDSKILGDKSARKLLKSLSLSPSSASKIMALGSTTTYSKATPPPEPPKPSKPFRIPIPFVPRPAKPPAPPAPPAPPTPLAPPTSPTQPKPPAPSPSILAPPVSTSNSAEPQSSELLKLSPTVLEPTVPEKAEKSQSAQSISSTSQDTKKPFKLFNWPNFFGSKSAKPSTSYQESEPKKASDSIATPTYSPPIESSTHYTTQTSVNLPVQSNKPAYSETIKPSRFFKFPSIFVPKPVKSPKQSSNVHELSSSSAQTTSKLSSKPSSTLPEEPIKSVESQLQNNMPMPAETSKPPTVFRFPYVSTLKPLSSPTTGPKPSDLPASSMSTAMESSTVQPTTAKPSTPILSAIADEPLTQSKTNGPMETTMPSNKVSFSSVTGQKSTESLVPNASASNTPSDKPPPNIVTEAEPPMRGSSTSVETASPSTQSVQHFPSKPASTSSTSSEQSSTFTSIEPSAESVKPSLLLPPSLSKISSYPTSSPQSPSLSAGPSIDQLPAISPSSASSPTFSPPSKLSPPQQSSASSSSLSSSFSSTGFSLTAPSSSSISSSFSSSTSFKSASSSFPQLTYSAISSGASTSPPTSPTNHGSKPVKSSSRFNFNKFFGSIMDGFASIRKPRTRRAEDRWSSSRRSISIDEEDSSSMIQQNLDTHENAKPCTGTETQTEEDYIESTVNRKSVSDGVGDKKIFDASAQENLTPEEASNFNVDEDSLTKIQKLNHVEDRNLHNIILRVKENEDDLAINEELNTNERDNSSHYDVIKNPSAQILHEYTVKDKFRIKPNSNGNTSMEEYQNNIKFENSAMAQDLKHKDSLSKNKMTVSKAVSTTPSEVLIRARKNESFPSKEGQTEQPLKGDSQNFSIRLGNNLR